MKALVTGGGGFLGRWVVEQLLARGDQVRSFSRREYPELTAQGVDCRQGDLADPAAVREACAGVDVVFHVAAFPGMWGKREVFERINVTGTQNVVAACRAAGAPKLVYTSSPSVVFPMGPLENADESTPYPERYYAHYPETKARAEQHVLAANGVEGLATCSLRPHLIYGPRDPHIVPMLLQRAREGKLVQIGDGSNRVDVTYVENAAHAHLLAADALTPSSPVAGSAYFISDAEPVNLWGFVNDLLARLDAPTVDKRLPFAVAYALAAGLEGVHRLVPALGEPRLTRFLVGNFAYSHYFDPTKAERELGYRPKVPHDEGVRRTVTWFRERAMTGDA